MSGDVGSARGLRIEISEKDEKLDRDRKEDTWLRTVRKEWRR